MPKKPTSQFLKELAEKLDDFPRCSTDELDVSTQLYLRQIDSIIEDDKIEVENKRHQIKEISRQMPGYFAFWNRTRPLALAIKEVLSRFPEPMLLKSELDVERAKIKVYKNKIAVLKKKHGNYSEIIKEKDDAIANLKQEIMAKNRMCEDVQKKYLNQLDKTEQLDQLTANQAGRINTLLLSLNSLETDAEEINSYIAQVEEVVENLKRIVGRKNEIIKQLEEVIECNDEEIATLKSRSDTYSIPSTLFWPRQQRNNSNESPHQSSIASRSDYYSLNGNQPPSQSEEGNIANEADIHLVRMARGQY